MVAAPTRFLRNWVATHYADRLLALWRLETPGVDRLSLIVDPRIEVPPSESGRRTEPQGLPESAGGSALPAETVPAEAVPAEAVPAEIAQAEIADDKWGYLSAPLDPRSTFENFVVGKPN